VLADAINMQEVKAIGSIHASSAELTQLYLKLEEPECDSPRSSPGSVNPDELVELPLEEQMRSQQETVQFKPDYPVFDKLSLPVHFKGQDPSILSQRHSRDEPLLKRMRSRDLAEDNEKPCCALV
jgi:hypothetical protein